MGAQIGCEYALGGHDVTLVARRPDGARDRARHALSMLEEHDVATSGQVSAAWGRLRATDDLARGASGCEIAVESLPERLDLKVELLSEVGTLAPTAILASNTSSLSITAIGDAIGCPERVIGTHYLNPPLLMPTVEVIPGGKTAASVVERVVVFLESLGKHPIVVRRDVPGFVWNRLQFALLRECAWLVENGVATAESVDAVVREALARRWRHVGPLRAIALGGVDTWNHAGRSIVPTLSTQPRLPDLAQIAILDDADGAWASSRDSALARELHLDETDRQRE